MSISIDPSAAYFAYVRYHPRESEDPRALWAAAWNAGGRAAIQDSGRLVELVPLLRDLLYSLEDGHVEAAVRASDRRPAFAHEDFGDLESEPDCRVAL
jgi:hypothetical protein